MVWRMPERVEDLAFWFSMSVAKKVTRGTFELSIFVGFIRFHWILFVNRQPPKASEFDCVRLIENIFPNLLLDFLCVLASLLMFPLLNKGGSRGIQNSD